MSSEQAGTPTQHCPICGSAQPLSAETCSACGAALAGERSSLIPLRTAEAAAPKQPQPRYDPAMGDDDLFMGDLSGRTSRSLLVGCLGLLLLLGVGLGVLVVQSVTDNQPGGSAPLAGVEAITTPRSTAPPTSTARASMTVVPAREMPKLSTVTPMPPTPSETPTPGPCYQTAQQGDSVLAMAYRCGHRELAIVSVILELNNLRSAEQLQQGQTLEIPWPTPTAGPGGAAENPDESTAPDEEIGDANLDATVPVNAFGTPNVLAAYQNAEPTLRPGQAWHTIRAGETILSIAFQYDAGLETLSQINPEVPFLQCDFGDPAGGPNCSVLLIEGQQIRVPVPVPTMTPTFTPVGTLTPTPTLSPTYNAPYLIAPDDGARFRTDEFVTLRWGGTGTLGQTERYLVRVSDLDSGKVHLATVPDTTYILPGGWQPVDRRRHTFEWTISVVEIDAQFNILSEDHIADPRRFTWESR